MCKMKLREVALVLFLLVLIQGGKGNNVSTEANVNKSIEGKNNGPKALDKSDDSLSSNLSSSDPTEEATVTTPATKNISLPSKVTQPVSTSKWSTSLTTLGVRQPAGVTTGNEQNSARSIVVQRSASINGPPTIQQINASTSAFPSTITLTTIVMGNTSKPRAAITKQSSAPSNGPLSTNKSIVSSTASIPSTSTLITATEEVSSTLISAQDENSKIEENTASNRSKSQTSTENTDSSESGAGNDSTYSSKEPASPDIAKAQQTSTTKNTEFSTATTADGKTQSSEDPTPLTESITSGEPLLVSSALAGSANLSVTTNIAAKSDLTTDRTQQNNANDTKEADTASNSTQRSTTDNPDAASTEKTSTEKSSTTNEETVRMSNPGPTTSDEYASSLSTNSIETTTTTHDYKKTTENNPPCNSKQVQNLITSSEKWKIVVSWESPCKGKDYTYSITKNETCLNPADPQTTNTNETSMIFDTGLRGDCNYTFSVAARLLNDTTNDTMIVRSKSTSLEKYNAHLKNEKIKAECRWNLSWTPESSGEVAHIEIISETKTKKINATNRGTATVEYTDLELKERVIVKLNLTNDKSVTIPAGESEIYANGTSAVQNLKFIDSQNLLSWEKPETICGSVKYYEVKIKGIKFNNTKEGSLEFRVDENVSQIQENVTAVVTPFGSRDEAGDPSEVKFKKTDDIPPEPSNNAQGNITGSADASKPSTVVISWPKDLFGSNTPVRWEVLIQNSSVANSEADNETGGFTVNAKKPLKWIEFIQGQKGFYRPTKDDWKPKEEGGKYSLVVGTEECNNEKDYCNGLLNPNTKYTYKIRGFSTIGFRDSRALSVETGEYTGVASQIVVSILFIAIAGVVMFGLYYTRRNHPRCIQKAMIYLRPLRQPRDQILEMQEKRPLVSKAIPKDEFSKYLEELLNIDENEETNELAEQFKQLALLSPPPPSTHPENYSAAMIQYNKHKNRYINILPYDSTRVVLKQISPNDPESDYINASYVKGFSGETEYIACQGPRADTAEDFWRMVFEKDVCVIAMVTHLEEKGKEKCHKYFPDMRETIRYEMVAVKCVLQADFPVFTRRTFLVQETNGVLLKTVIHLHFKEWPDFGCPETTDLLLNYTKNLREAANEHKGGLMLVHCSAGVGRTGTLIALDILLQQIRVSTSFNIFDTILQMRYHRINMVQTEAQYKFIHECVRDAIEEEKKNGQWFAIGNGGANKQDPIYQNLNKEKSVSIVTEINEIDDEVDSEIEKSAEGNSTEGTQDQIYQNVNKERPPSIKIDINEVKDKVATNVDLSSVFGQQKPPDIDLIKNHAKNEVDTKIEKSAEHDSPGENQDPIYLNVSQEKPPESQESTNDGSGGKPTQPIIPVLHLANAAEAINENVEMTEEIVPLVEQSETLEVTKL